MEPEDSQNQINLVLSDSTVTPAGEFEVIAINAGTGNGWEFSADVLQSSLALWDGRQCFVDHSYWGQHSVRDLAGIFYGPSWDPENKGIKLKLKAVGPSGPLLAEIGRQILANPDVKPNVGFSADVAFTAKDRKVMQITKIQSVDLVINPARGGAFIRALNSAIPDYFQEEKMEPESVVGANGVRPLTINQTQLQTEAAATALLAAEQARIRATLAEEAKAAHELRVGMCAQFLDSALSMANLLGQRLPPSLQGQRTVIVGAHGMCPFSHGDTPVRCSKKPCHQIKL
ncbi:MAG: hypothetical protein P4L50_15925 [Anaerolineaceae bacterium]|nr:hypothetical protein [Anaerolineaceae bacterium]